MTGSHISELKSSCSKVFCFFTKQKDTTRRNFYQKEHFEILFLQFFKRLSPNSCIGVLACQVVRPSKSLELGNTEDWSSPRKWIRVRGVSIFPWSRWTNLAFHKAFLKGIQKETRGSRTFSPDGCHRISKLRISKLVQLKISDSPPPPKKTGWWLTKQLNLQKKNLFLHGSHMNPGCVCLRVQRTILLHFFFSHKKKKN